MNGWSTSRTARAAEKSDTSSLASRTTATHENILPRTYKAQLDIPIHQPSLLP